MSRLPYLRRDQVDEQGGSLWDTIASTRGAAIVNDQGGLIGPFNAWVHAPEIGTRLAELGGLFRFQTSVERRLIEVAIITVGARWKSEFEWWAHSRMALENGVAAEVIEAIRTGETPEFPLDDERVVYEAARQLAAEGRISDATYAEAEALLGPRGLVEVIALCGYYTLVSFTLNAFTVPLPPGVPPIWE